MITKQKYSRAASPLVRGINTKCILAGRELLSIKEFRNVLFVLCTPWRVRSHRKFKSGASFGHIEGVLLSTTCPVFCFIATDAHTSPALEDRVREWEICSESLRLLTHLRSTCCFYRIWQHWSTPAPTQKTFHGWVFHSITLGVKRKRKKNCITDVM